MRPAMSEHERILLRESIRNFAGGRSPDPVVSRHCRERSRQALLNDPEIPEGRKQQLRADGPPGRFSQNHDHIPDR